MFALVVKGASVVPDIQVFKYSNTYFTSKAGGRQIQV